MSLVHRPHVHFTPAHNWMNDPNGLIYYKGKYHLFFQYNPEGDQWGNMSWGHATSSDLQTWTELPLAISYTSSHGVFSGSAVVDYLNTSGFGTPDNPAMVAIFTEHKHDESEQVQSLAYSNDEGVTWQRYESNPVLSLKIKDFRDPKVTWNAVNESWVMSVVKPHEYAVCFYRSYNLKDWELLSEFTNKNGTDGIWECPDLFPLAVDANPAKIKWVLFISVNPGGISGGSGTHYFIGDWNGKEFIADDLTTRWLDYGRDNYAGVTFNDAPNNRRIYIGWMNNWEYADKIPANPSRGSMTIPRELTLVTVEGRITLLQNPVEEITSPAILDYTFVITPTIGKSGVRFSRSDGSSLDVGYDTEKQILYLDRSAMWFNFTEKDIEIAPLDSRRRDFNVRVLIDSTSIEIFAVGGQVSMTDLVTPGDIPEEIVDFSLSM